MVANIITWDSGPALEKSTTAGMYQPAASGTTGYVYMSINSNVLLITRNTPG